MALPEPTPGAVRSNEGPLVDRFGRVHTYLRVSVTDRCNYRCTYCMPLQGIDWIPRKHLLSYEEITRVVGAFARMGVRRIRLTGGEPTLRQHLDRLIANVAAIDGIEEIAMTTNGHLFSKKAELLSAAGLNRINISLDSLDSEQFKRLTRGGDLKKVLLSIDKAIELGLTPVKINCVIVGGENENQLQAMVDYFSERPGTHVRFIEYMPFGDTGGRRQHVPVRVLRERLAAVHHFEPITSNGGGPSRDVKLDNGLVVGFISPMTEHFCDACNRLRLQADGSLRTCLSRDQAPNLRDLLRSECTDEQLDTAIRAQLWNKVAGHEAHIDGDFRTFDGNMTQVGG